MSYRPYQEITRRKSRRVHVGSVPVGDGAPITVQTMTNTLTTDVAGTIAQIRRAELAGVDIVRVSCPDQESALALKDIVHEVNAQLPRLSANTDRRPACGRQAAPLEPHTLVSHRWSPAHARRPHPGKFGLLTGGRYIGGTWPTSRTDPKEHPPREWLVAA